MPRNLRILTLFAAIIMAAILAGLYLIRSNSVHDAIPPALAALKADPAPRQTPAATWVDEAGRSRSLAEYRGRVVILNMWATWCAPCVRELPALGRLQAALGHRQVTVVAVNAGHDTAAGTVAFLKAHEAANLAPFRDPELSLLANFGAQGLPFSVIVDAKGREIARAAGPMQWDDPDAIAYFRSLGARAPS